MSLDKSAYSKFLEFHSHPKALSPKDLESLENLIQEFPYCQSIKMLALTSAESTNRYNSLLQEASAFSSSRSILYDFIHQPELFVADLDTSKHSQDEHDNGLFESNNAFGINLNEILGSEWNEEKIKEQPEEKSTNAFGIDLSEILGSEFQEKKSKEEPQDLEIETKESIPDEVKVGDNPQEIVEKTIPEESNDQLLKEQELVVNDEELGTSENQLEEKIEDIELISGKLESENIEEDINEKGPIEEKEEENSDQDEAVQEEENILDSIAEENHEITPELESVKAEGEEIIQEEEAALKNAAINNEIISEEVAQEPTEELGYKVKTKEITGEFEEEIVDQEHIEFEVTVENEAESTSEKEIDIESTASISGGSSDKVEGGEITSQQIEKPILEEVKNEVASKVEVLKEEHTESETSIEESQELIESVKESAKELAFESPVHSDFLTFVDNENPKKIEEQKEEIAAYNDDTMPYTFLWWLNKTRKEYAESHQPYVKSKSSSIKLDTQQEIRKQEKDDLNHQIAENIFHLRGVEEFTGNSSRTPTVPFEFLRKDFQIIEKFIKEEPQIRPPAPNKIDTENKAKKSSEDSNEMVSETLAKIYVEQMLYHKALDVYKKLSLKFPEKSAYFASQIKYLELKVN